MSLILNVITGVYRKQFFFILKNISKVTTLKNKCFIIGFVLLSCQCISSQQITQDSTYNKLYFHIAVNLSSKKPQKALHLSDSLYKAAHSNRKKIKALLLSADILAKQNKQADGVHYALKALKFAKKSFDYNYQARIYGFLSTQCRTIGFYERGKYYLKQGLAANTKSDERKKLTYQAMANHEMAEYALINKDYTKGLYYIDKAIAFYNVREASQYNSFVLANCQQLKARFYNELNKDTLALRHFKNAWINLNSAKAKNSIFGGLVCQGIGETYLKLMNTDSAHLYLIKAFELSKPLLNDDLNEKVYGSLSSYYLERGETDSAVFYLTKYNETLREARNHNRQQLDKVMGYLKEDLIYEDKSNWLLKLGMGILLVLGGLRIYFYRNKQDLKTDTKENETEASLHTTAPMELSQEMIETFNQKLIIFKLEERFLDRTLSFSVLAAELGTNTKYLNSYFKHNLQTDYPTYINTLRIEYITNQLVKHPHTRKYTLAHLADMSGYGSYSAFAVNFKRVMNQTPSSFIQSLK